MPGGLTATKQLTYGAAARTRTGAQETRMTTATTTATAAAPAPRPSRSRLRGFLLSSSSPLGLRSPAPSNADRTLNTPRSHSMSLTAPDING